MNLDMFLRVSVYEARDKYLKHVSQVWDLVTQNVVHCFSETRISRRVYGSK